MKYFILVFLIFSTCSPMSFAQNNKKPTVIRFYEQADSLSAQCFLISAEQDRVLYSLMAPNLLSNTEPELMTWKLGGLEQITLQREGAKGKGRILGTLIGFSAGALVGLPLLLNSPNPDIDQAIPGELIGGLFWGTSTILGFTIGGAIGQSRRFIVLDDSDEFLPGELERLKNMAWNP